MKSKLSVGSCAKSTSSDNNAVCLICFEWFEKTNCSDVDIDVERSPDDLEIVVAPKPADGNDDKHEQRNSPPDLYTRFLAFITRYLGLESSGPELLKSGRAKTESVQPFCEKCQYSVKVLCDLFRDLEELKIRLSWRLSEFGNRMDQGSKSVSRKLRNLVVRKLVEELNAQTPSFVDVFRKKLMQKCKWKAKKLDHRSPQVRINRGLDRGLWKFSYSATEKVLKQLIVVCLLGSTELTNQSRKGRRSHSREKVIKVSSPSDEDDSFGDAFSPAVDNDDSYDYEPELQEEVTSNSSDDDFQKALLEPGREAPKRGRGRPRRSCSTLAKSNELSEEEEENEADDWAPPPTKRKKLSTTVEKYEGPKRGRGRPKGSRSKLRTIVQKYKDIKRGRRGPGRPPGPGRPIGPGHRCKECPEMFQNLYELHKHRRTVHNLALIKIECPICFRLSVTQEDFDRHMKRHEQNEIKGDEELFTCEVCGKSFCKQSTVDEHFQEVHDGVYECLQPECKATFSSAPELWEHLETVHEDKDERVKLDKGVPFKKQKLLCIYCYRSFTTRQYKEIHKKIFHHKNRFFCDKRGCFVECSSTDALKDHIKTHVSPKRISEENVADEGVGGSEDGRHEIFCCSICERSFYQKDNMKFHVLLHTPHATNRRGFDCAECSRNYRNLDALLRHFLVKHRLIQIHSFEWFKSRSYRLDVDGPFKCEVPDCEEAHPSRIKLKAHLANDHGRKDLLLPCKTCGLTFLEDDELEHHILTNHEERKFKCRICGNLYMRRQNLREHMRFHEGAFKCKVCLKQYRRSSHLHYHVRTAHDPTPLAEGQKRKRPTFMCSLCGATFRSSTTLNSHNFRVHGQGTPKFECEKCGMQFLLRHKYDAHVITHDKSRTPSFICSLCGSAYMTQFGLIEHTRLKHENVRYECKDCNKVYNTRSGLVYHMQAIHLEPDRRRFVCKYCGKKEDRPRVFRDHEKRCEKKFRNGTGPGPSQEFDGEISVEEGNPAEDIMNRIP